MPSYTTYCNIIGTTDGELRNNHLWIGDSVTKPIGETAEADAEEMFKDLCRVLGCKEVKQEDLDDMIEDGTLVSTDKRVKVFINWPNT